MLEAALFFAILGSLGYVAFRREKRVQAFIATFAVNDPIYLSQSHTLSTYQVVNPGEKDRWRRGVLIITHKRLALYDPFAEDKTPLFHAAPDELQGFWRPVKYHEDGNEIWIHAQIGLSWVMLKIRLTKNEMQKLVRALKAIATEEQIKAYRRRRPYIHRDPTLAYPAKQTLQGEWELFDPVQIYLMPLSLVIFQKQKVQDVLPLADMQRIASLKRMEGGEPAGLIRFDIGDQHYAFALGDYESWANDLAEAAKRTLEDPVERKRKSKSEDDDEE